MRLNMEQEADEDGTCRRLICAASVVASVCRICTFCSSSTMYRILRSLDRAADCRFASTLRTQSKLDLSSHDPQRILGK